jgi:amidase
MVYIGFRWHTRQSHWKCFNRIYHSGWFTFGVQGPMARTIQDVALMLSVIAGPDPRSPISIQEDGRIFLTSLEHDFTGARIAWSPDLGELPVDPRVTAVLEAQRPIFKELGCIVEESAPDLEDADEIFKIWRAWRFEMAYSNLLERHRELLKDTVVWNIEEGIKLTGPQIGLAEIKRTQLYHCMRRYMNRYDFLVLPTSQVPPFDVRQRYVTEINTVKMDTYISWMKSCYFITVTGLPAISVPYGFTPEGLPIGIQIVGRPQGELRLLQLAFAFEQLTQVGKIRPPLLAVTPFNP